jgi:MFS family permease
LIVAGLMFFSSDNYRLTFGFLFLPFLILLVTLMYTYKRIGSPKTVEPPKAEGIKEKLPRPLYIYTFAVLLNTVGLIPYTLILYKASVILQPTNDQWIVPLIYFLIQGVDAPAALMAGFAYDKFGVAVLILPFLLSLFPPLFAFIDGGLLMLIVAAAVFGLVLGMQESIYRAAISQLSPISSRGTAYGIFNAAYGFGLLISGAIYGVFMDFKSPFIVIVFYVFIIQVAAIASLLNVKSKLKRNKQPLNVN